MSTLTAQLASTPVMVTRQLLPDDLEPDLLKIGNDIYAKWQAAALRVAAHSNDPKKFVLPTTRNTPEAILSKRFNYLAKSRPDIASAASARAVQTLAWRKTRDNFRTAVALDFNRNVSVNDLVVADGIVASDFTKEHVERLIERHYADLGMQKTSFGAPPDYSKVHLEMLRMVCIDETNGFLGSEAGSDEIYLGATTLNETGTAGKVNPTKIGNFDDGTRKDFSPAKRLFTWNVNTDGNYPKHYFATMLLWEKDNGELDETFEKLYNKFVSEVATKVAALLGTAVGGLFGGPLGAAVGAMVGWIVGWLINKIANYLVRIWEDDMFIPKTIEFIIPNAEALNSQPSKVFHFDGPGEYAVRYRWTVER